jgi:type I restriction enzyme R protein
MLELSLPGFDYKVKKQNGTVMIFDIVRKKYVVLTPEEWVRQHVVHYLVEKKGYAISRVAVEREIELYGLKRRFDIVVFDRSGNPWLLVECKAPAVALTQKVFDQVFRYNLTLAAPYVAITNGVCHFCGYMNQENDFCFLDDFPEFSQERELLA